MLSCFVSPSFCSAASRRLGTLSRTRGARERVCDSGLFLLVHDLESRSPGAEETKVGVAVEAYSSCSLAQECQQVGSGAWKVSN